MSEQDLQLLNAISPLDGRYRSRLNGLSNTMSEAALIRSRIKVELSWLGFLLGKQEINSSFRHEADEALTVVKKWLKEIPEGAESAVKEIEKTTNHDVKAVEYYLQNELKRSGVSERVLALVHFGCTSEDINNLAYAQMLAELRHDVLLPEFDKILALLIPMVKELAEVPMLSRTHGQPASPTTLGKELAVFGHRLYTARVEFADVVIEGKISGAVGNFNAHKVALPEVDWIGWGKEFIERRLGLVVNPLTTQIENHDWIARYNDSVRRMNTILIDMCRDLWGYISLGYFKLKLIEGEVGSSTMPHKINPIDFENAEGNLGISSSLLNHLSEKLPISRWQRDLSDSTALRSLGVAFGHSFLSATSVCKGLSKLAVNLEAVEQDLDDAWEVLGEAVQTVMRLEGDVNAYDRLKKATRGKKLDEQGYASLLSELKLDPAVTERLKDLTPKTYLGDAVRMAHEFVATHSHLSRGQ